MSVAVDLHVFHACVSMGTYHQHVGFRVDVQFWAAGRQNPGSVEVVVSLRKETRIVAA